MQKPKSPHPVDIHVGRRVQVRRSVLGMAQSGLADQLGLTYQQLQKYERGANRISVSRLWEIAHILDVPVIWFFEGLGGDHGSVEDPVDIEALNLVSIIQALPKDLETRLGAAIKAVANSLSE